MKYKCWYNDNYVLAVAKGIAHQEKEMEKEEMALITE